MQKIFSPCLLTLSLSLLLPLPAARAADSPHVTLTNGQTETVASGQSVSFNNTGDNSDISIKGTSTSAANKITINNSGTISSAPGSTSGRAIRDASGSSNSVINNNAGGLITSSGDDTISVTAASGNTTASIIDVENHGTIQSLDANGSGTTIPGKSGNQAVNVAATTSGNSMINNYDNGVIWATAADGVRPGSGGFVNNDGFIYSNAFQGSGSDGIDVEGKSVSGQTFNLVVSGVTIVNGATTTVPGGTVAAYQSSTPLSGYVGASTNVAMTESTIEGGRHGITGGNVGVAGGTAQVGGYLGDGSYSMSVTNNQGALIEGQDGSGINIDGFGIKNGSKFYTNESVVVNNYGTITGNGISRDGDGIDVDGDVAVNNQGSILSKNSASTTPGTIEFSEGVTVGGGTITNGSSTNSAATIEGSVASGNTSAVGRGITLAGIDHDTADVDFPIESIYENSSITNSGLIKGDSESGVAVLGTTGGGYSVTITNNATGTIAGDNTGTSERANITYNSVTSSNGQSLNQGAIELDDAGNTYEVDNYGTITQSGASGVAVAMHSTSSNVLNIYGGSIGGDVTGDTSADSKMTIATGTNGTFSFAHNISNFAVEVKTGKFTLNGTISGGTTTIDAGATLGGNANVGGLIISGTLSPGNSPGKVTATSVVLNPTGDFLLQVDTDGSTGAAGTNWDQLAVSGLVDGSALGTGAGQQFSFNLQSLMPNDTAGSLASWNPDVNHVWHDVVTSTAFTTPLSSQDFSVNSSGFANRLDGSFSIQTDGTSLDLVYTAAPEPGTWAMLVGGVTLLFVAARRRKLAL